MAAGENKKDWQANMNSLYDLQNYFKPLGKKNKKLQVQKKILLIEDDFDTREVVKEALFTIKDWNVQVTSAFNGLEALSYLSIHKDTDLIILDLMMPSMNGIDFLRGLLGMNEPLYLRTPILITSGADEGRNIAKEHGVNFLAKPFGMDKLMSEVKHLLGRVEQ